LAVGKFQKIKQNLMEDLGREPNTVELADSLTWAPREVERMENELRKDLAITTGGEEEAFFENIMFSTDTTSELLFFVYYEADPEEKLILEYSLGYGGKPRLDVKDIALRIGKPEVYVRRKRTKFAEKVNNAKRLGAI
jgi:hypothetical protein